MSSPPSSSSVPAPHSTSSDGSSSSSASSSLPSLSVRVVASSERPPTSSSNRPPHLQSPSLHVDTEATTGRSSAASSWTDRWSPSAALGRARMAMKQSETQQSNVNVRYRPLQLLDESDGDSDDEWQGEARGDPSCSITGSLAQSAAMEAASEPLTRSLLERESLASFLQSSWVFLLLLSCLAAMTAWSVDAAVLLLTKWHAAFVAMGGGWLDQYLFYILFRVTILLLAVGCTVFFCPEAAGSGIPEMRSILGGFPFPNYLSARALVAKCLGLSLALGSGLSIGKEGPFVHLSSIIARQLLGLSWFEQIRKSSDLTHHVLAAACAVGVTASFGAPVGGVLFSIEVTTSYYVTSNYWRAFFSSVVAVVVFRGLNSLLAGSYGTLFTTEFGALPYETYEIAFFLLLAVICGLLGALFVRSYRMLLGLKKRFEDQYLLSWCGSYPGLAPFVYAAFVAFMFSLVEFPVGSFMQLTQRQTINDMFSAGKLESDKVTTHLEVDFGSSWTSPSLLLNLFAYVLVRFWSTVISATVLVPSGIVTPVFAIGAALGRMFGEMVVILSNGELLVAGYAVVGAASFTAGVTGTISIAVIVFELTGQLSYMIPVLLCVIVGRAVTLFFSLDMYETMSRQRNLPQWPDLTKQKSYSLTAGDLMRDVQPYYLVRRQTLASIKHLLHVTSSGKKGSKTVRLFPVVDDAKTMILLGVATRDELEALVVQWELSLQRAKTATNIDTRVAVAGLTPEQAAELSRPASETLEVVDLVRLELLTLDDEHFHVPRDTFASHVILLISMHKCPELFVTQRGKLQGSIHAADLLARSRRYTL